MFKKLTIFRESLKQRKLDKLTDDLRNNSLNIRMKAVRALGKIGDPRAVMPLLSLLSSASNGKNEARQIVIDTITQIGKPAITLLVNSLRDENGQTRAAAAEALEKLGWQPTVEIEKVYYFAAKGQFNLLVPLGATAVEPLIEMLGRKGFSESGAIVSCLGKIGDLRAVEPLIKVLTGNLSYLPSTAAVALGNIGDLRAVEPLIKMLTDDNEIARYARYEVAIALGSIGDPRAIESLKKALNDRTPRVRAAAAEALEKLRWQPTVEIEKVYYFAAKRKFRPLIGLGSIAVEGLINFLQHEAENVLRDGLDPTPLETVIEELGEIGDARAVQELAHMLDGGYARVQEAAAKALGKISDPSAVMVLIHATISYNTFHEAKMAALAWIPMLVF
jgi:HEAT repeat protein